MENASKALIIAGAILISILLISVGVMIVGSTDGLQDQMTASMTEQEIQAFNAKFYGYEGDKVKGSQVKTLIQTIAANNIANDVESGDEKFVDVTFIYKTASGTVTANDTDNARANVKSAKTYTVECELGDTGLVKTITITEN